MWVPHSLFANSPAVGHFICFRFWVVPNKAALNVCVQVFIGHIVSSFLLSSHVAVEWPEHMGGVDVTELAQSSSRVAVRSYTPARGVRAPVSPHLAGTGHGQSSKF